MATWKVTVLDVETGEETGDVYEFMARDIWQLWRSLAYYLQLSNGRAGLTLSKHGQPLAYALGRCYFAKKVA